MREMRTIDTGDASLRCAIEGEGPLVIMVHGFPESWYSWRHQIGPVADAGFTACAIDVRGYGGSDKPEPVGAYAVRLHFDDGHSTGLYSWETFYELGQHQTDYWQAYLNRLTSAGYVRKEPKSD